ncbi:MAG: KUP/HAK/KT family potassium transporter [Actinobacteria bacterium]|nr:KUP/HAK/KT family potassium transporter [Actinomycetota bacterium]
MESATTPAIATAVRRPVPSGLGRLALGAIGVVFGDIGTSVLYTFEEVFAGPHRIDPEPERVLAAVSMIFWTLTLIVSVKYVLVVMRAANNGEGGIMALTALITRLHLSKRSLALLSALGVFGAALFYGDGMITPAVSVLSAIEGIEVAAPGLRHYVEVIAIVVLLVLFGVQRFGTHRVGGAFGPVMLLWLLAIAGLGVASIVQTPEVLAAISPTHAIGLIVSEPLVAFLSLGSVVLCVTGAEALYADMGHFGAKPIRVSWFAVVSVALYLNYFGQGALVIRSPEAAEDPFYLLVPTPLLWPMIILATLATVIASQAVISGAFSMTEEAIRLHYLPRLAVLHTSAEQRGQIYVPFVNWALCVAVVALILGFRDSSNLASAYGIAVTGTFLITTVLITVVARRHWHAPLWLVIPGATLFGIIDLSFFGANLTKFFHGGWFPLLVGVVLFTVFMTWKRGLDLLRAKSAAATFTPAELTERIAADPARDPGTMIFATGSTAIPLAVSEFLRRGGRLRSHNVHVALLVQPVPEVADDSRVRFVDIVPGALVRMEVRYGFMETPDGAAIMTALNEHGVPTEIGSTIVVYHSIRAMPTSSKGMAIWRKHLFSFLLRNSSAPQVIVTAPSELVMEWSSLRRL